ncbi:MAG: spermidine synthase [Janthinobacterium sp.]|jgi:spermidine synthase
MKENDRDDDIKLPVHFKDALAASAGRPFAFDHGDIRTLHFDECVIQSAMRISAPRQLLLSYTRAMMAFMLFKPQPLHIVMIGLGGGSLAKYCYDNLPETRISVLEVDADVIALRGRFLIPDDDARFRIIHADAVDAIAAMGTEAGATADVILHDGYSADGLPSKLSTPAFYGACCRALSPGGVLVSNLWGEAVDLVPLMQRLHAAFDARLWWCGAGGDVNRIVFSIKAGAPVAPAALLQKRAAQYDLRHDLFFCDLLDRLQHAGEKSAAAFEAMAGNDMRAAFMQLAN